MNKTKQMEQNQDAETLQSIRNNNIQVRSYHKSS